MLERIIAELVHLADWNHYGADFSQAIKEALPKLDKALQIARTIDNEQDSLWRANHPEK